MAAAQNCGEPAATYYLYPKNTNDSTFVVRTRELMVETDLKTKDTTAWKLKWKDACIFSVEFLSGSKKLKPEEQEFLKSHKLIFKTAERTADYFIYESYIDKVSGNPFLVDTAFYKRKSAPVDNRLFVPVKLSDLKKQRFSDTSKYAVVGIYRKGEFTCSAVEGLVYLNDEVIAGLKTKSAYLFKVYKEGTLKFGSSFNNKISVKNVQVQFGKRYYIQIDPVWAQSCKPELIVSDDAQAKQECESLLQF